MADAKWPVAVRQATAAAHGQPVQERARQLLAQRFANCVWLVITQYGKVGNLIYATQARAGSATAAPLYDLQVLLGRQEDDLPLVYARQIVEAMAADRAAGEDGRPADPGATPLPVLLGIAMRDHSPEAFQDVLAALPQSPASPRAPTDETTMPGNAGLAAAAASLGLAPRPLFGGACTCLLPADMVDFSTMRDVPDNQECFGRLNGPESVIIDILERVDAPDATCAVAHFDVLAAENEAPSSSLSDPPRILSAAEFPFTGTAGALCCFARGRQAIAKYRQRQRFDTVELWVAVVRLPSVHTDIVVTLNRPLLVNDPSDTAGATAHAVPADAYSDLQAAALTAALLESFRVVDWNLFAADGTG